MSLYIKQVVIALDQFVNAILGGWADETLSARAHRQNYKYKWMIAEKLIDIIFFFQPNHCAKSYENELLRRQSFQMPAKNITS